MGLSDWKRITSRSNPLIVRTAKLSSRKFREETSSFFFEGLHLLEEYLRFGWKPETVFVHEDCAARYAGLLERVPEDAVVVVPESVFDKLTTEQAPQGLLTVSRLLPCVPSVSDPSGLPGRILMLESVRDSGNVGTVIRTAAAFGWTCLLTPDCADVWSHKTVRASMGTLFSGCVSVCADPAGFVRACAAGGRRVFAAALGNGERLGSFPIRPDDCFVVGNEGQGVSRELIEASQSVVTIPMTASAESLNAAVAAAVLMWEGFRSDGHSVPGTQR